MVNASKKCTNTLNAHSIAFGCDYFGKVNEMLYVHCTIFPHDETKILEFKREKKIALNYPLY